MGRPKRRRRPKRRGRTRPKRRRRRTGKKEGQEDERESGLENPSAEEDPPQARTKPFCSASIGIHDLLRSRLGSNTAAPLVTQLGPCPAGESIARNGGMSLAGGESL